MELKNKFEWNWKKKLKRDFLISTNFHQNFRISSMEEGYHLWEEYVNKALSLKNEHKQYVEIKYEDFLENPFQLLKQLADFSGLDVDDAKINNEIRNIKPDRSYAFLKNPEYCKFYDTLKQQPLMQQLGYDQL